MFPPARQEESCRPTNHHISCMRTDTFIASHVTIHEILPKALTFAPAPWWSGRVTEFTLSSSLGKSVPPLSPSKFPMKSEQDILFPMF